MPANRSQYTDGVLDARSANGNTVRHWFGKLHVDKSTHLARFYLDEILATVDLSGVRGYLGVCNAGSVNYNMHNASRRGCIGSGAAAGNGITFQDGGLNTLPFTSAVTAVNGRLGNIQISQSVKSAWYVTTDTIGIQYKNTANVFVNWLTFVGIQAEAITATKTIIGQEFDGFLAGATIEVRGYVTNVEGTYYSASVSFMILLAQFSLKHNATVASTADSGSVFVTVFSDRVPLFDGGTRLFKTEVYPLAYIYGADSGYYIYNGWWYKVGELTPGGWKGVLDFGRAVAGQWPAGDPANPATYSELVFNAYSTIGGVNACSTAESEFTRYVRVADGLAYTTTGFGTLIPDGYYTRGTGTAKKWYQYTGGAIVAQGFCTAPE